MPPEGGALHLEPRGIRAQVSSEPSTCSRSSAATAFQGDERRADDQARIAELERMVERLATERRPRSKKKHRRCWRDLDRKRAAAMTLAGDYATAVVCRALGSPRGSFYRRRPGDGDHPIREALLRPAGRWPTYGYRRPAVMLLRREGHEVNGKRVRRLMHELQIVGTPPARRTRTTASGHRFPRYLDLVEGREGSLTVAALRRAPEWADPEIHHSGQGMQYAATAYIDLLAGRGVAISMAAVGKPEEDGYAERLVRTIKEGKSI